MKVAGEHEWIVLAGIEVHPHRKAAQVTESFYLSALPRTKAKHARAIFQNRRQPFLQQPPVIDIVVPEIKAGEFGLLVADVFLVGGVFALLELSFVRRGAPAISRARAEEQNAEKL